MNLPDVLPLARLLMEEHGVGTWSVSFDRARRRAGQTDHTRRRITLSRQLMALYDEAEVRETVLHEIAHARVGAAHGHDAVWRAEALRIGASGKRLVDSQAPRVRGRWVGTCPAGHTVDRMRRPALPCSCSRCARGFSPEHLLSWSLDGVAVPHESMGKSYVRALHQVL
ncbi:SprT-like domain-containing protein [Actinomyces sp. MRS3W]|uniref:SprT-like domain-containing protein n=1 Tax=Actinomyces sp. MRS3W TaxID=2800796 RepID=UPI0028FD0FC9|nr:SprT-like domain-containing protein [Actinomyces sp. MRS3W]MDU0347562.1 SprT-like domain-containing protein [Actinomyces sp. MRS3W]